MSSVPNETTTTTTTTVFILGAGVGGLSFAAGLRKRFPGFDDFMICEKSDGLGGTWRANKYPGAASDVPIMYYTNSTFLLPHWKSTHGAQPDILAYWEEFADRFRVREKITFSTTVLDAKWDAEEQEWCIQVMPTPPIGAVYALRPSVVKAKVLVSAGGILEVPSFAGIEGVKHFKAGPLCHSARWDVGEGEDALEGKRVAVIGCGATAAQIIPAITASGKTEVVQFCRTPSWFLWNLRNPVGSIKRAILKWVPGAKRVNRAYYFWKMESLYYVVFSNKFANGLYKRWCTYYIKKNAPKEYHDKMIPSYDPGCKRLVVNFGYLDALHRPNMSMNWDGVGSVVEDGLVTKTGEKMRFDAIVFATGFEACQYHLPIQGLDGLSIQDYWASQGGPCAYRGTLVPGFPNLFMLGGPNTATGHTSVIFTEECQINLVLDLLKPILAGKLSSLDVTPKAADAWNDKLQARLRDSVFTGCMSWYRSGQTGKVHATFPGSGAQFWWWVRGVSWRDFEVVKKEVGYVEVDGKGKGKVNGVVEGPSS